MTIDQYIKWANEIDAQQDAIIKTQQFQRICCIFVQDVWLDLQLPVHQSFLKSKADIMFELQGRLVK